MIPQYQTADTPVSKSWYPSIKKLIHQYQKADTPVSKYQEVDTPVSDTLVSDTGVSDTPVSEPSWVVECGWTGIVEFGVQKMTGKDLKYTCCVWIYIVKVGSILSLWIIKF